MPTTLWCSAARVAITGRGWFQAELGAERHNPFVLEQLDRTGSLVWVAVETLLEEVDTSVTKLLLGW